MVKRPNATYTRLRDGSWGVRIQSTAARAGDVVDVTVLRRDGQARDHTVRVVRTFMGARRYADGVIIRDRR